MSDLLQKDNTGILRLIREANLDEVDKGIYQDKVIWVFKNGKNNKHALFVHSNKVGKKVYRTLKKNVEYLQEKPKEKEQLVKKDYNESASITIGDLISKASKEKLLKYKNSFGANAKKRK